MDLTFLFLLIIAGFGAGVVTGLAGASAATIVTPVMSMLAGLPAYTAITIALFTDVFASSASAYTFWKNGNINIKKGLFVSIFVVTGSIIGSYISTKVSSDSLGMVSLLSILLVSINFLKKADRMKKEDEGLIEKQEPKLYFQNNKNLAIIFFGLFIGFLCGFVGAGGGLMILLMLSSILGLDTKTGVGTSVLVMTFTALSGGIAHLPNVAPLENGMSLFLLIVISGVFGIIGAKLAANYANKVKEYMLLRIVAVTFLTLIGVSLVTKLL
ncbi:MAG: sulfite exporter TauE/SafE family protein [Lachnospirales bacterium]